MRLFSRLIFLAFSNSLAILAADYFIAGFSFSGDFIDLITVAAVLALINIFIRPIMKLILSPFIIITFGLFILVINAAVIYFLDFFAESITIDGLLPLVLSTLLFGIINIFINSSARSLFKS